MDADDVALPERFARQVAFLQAHPEVGVVGAQMKFVDASKERVVYAYTYPLTHPEIAWRMIFLCAIPHPTVMARKEIFEQARGYNAQFAEAEDYELWLRAVFFTQFANLPETCMVYRRHDQAVSVIHQARQQQNAVHVRLEYLKRLTGLEISPEMLSWLDQGQDLGTEQQQVVLDIILRVMGEFVRRNWLTFAEGDQVYPLVLDRLSHLEKRTDAPPSRENFLKRILRMFS
jgi:hypothetical protein